jgi:DNA-binding response OmpR family regulator/DNA-binding CsgD family transcriptional regulator
MSFVETEERRIALVVDDSPDTLSMVSTALEENGISTLVATNGRAALDLARRILPDVVLLDAIMPGLDGFETCAMLKADSALAYVPVIFMTGLTEPENIVRGLQAGGVDYVTKPALIDELVARMTTHIVNAKAVQSARQALDASGRSIIAVSRSGELLWGSPNAMELIEKETTGNTNLLESDAFLAWLQSVTRRAASQSGSFTSDAFSLQFVNMSAGGEILLKIRRQQNVSPEAHLAGIFNLTPREAEVLYWLSMGKTNRDIAQILSLSSRTINKHLEQVFQKMGMDNRTAAAVAADRIINALT